MYTACKLLHVLKVNLFNRVILSGILTENKLQYKKASDSISSSVDGNEISLKLFVSNAFFSILVTPSGNSIFFTLSP